ncbi:hypothetical protein cyc_03583 [Cyclospora cayetanensis]|uniref:Uncharacterized protein n=1 Tax=Cyclospora cayetanensis TaxID=88456 RepID=A0A1D3CTL7_9EIME|nr:hypothetical protein cyc_03583 [Cyclospora cayetanensis]
MEGSSDAPQYYYDSQAQQWWVFNTAQGEWELCPDSEQTAAAFATPTAAPDTPDQQQQLRLPENETASASANSLPKAGASPPAAQAVVPMAVPPAKAAGGSSQNSSVPSAHNEPSCTSPSVHLDPSAATAAAGRQTTGTAPSEERTVNSASRVPPSLAVPSNGGLQVDLSAAVEESSRGEALGFSAPEGLPTALSEESSGEEDALGNALKRLMTTTVSRGQMRRAAAASGSTSFPWPLGISEAADSDDDGKASSKESSSSRTPTPEPIVRRVTRCMTFKEQGGLAGCLQKAVQLRQHLIDTEKGGHVPGAEDADIKEEAWKIKARARAKSAGTVARERAKNRWRAAALELANGHQQEEASRKTSNAGAQRFADIVALAAAARARDLSRPGSEEGFQGRRASEDINPALVAAESSAAQQLPFVWNRRRSSEVHSRIRFADSTLRDPTYEQEVSGLLSNSRKGSAATPSPSLPFPQSKTTAR